MHIFPEILAISEHEKSILVIHKPDSEELARGIQHKIIQGPVAEPPVMSMGGKPIKKEGCKRA